MKTIRRLMILAGLSVALFALSEIGARGEALFSPHFAGTFTLPFEAHWGALTLPSGDYSLRYGTQENGHGLVFVRGTAKGSPYGMIFTGSPSNASTAKSVIVCVRQDNVLIVRALELPTIGEAVRFALPHGVKVRALVVAGKRNKKGNTQLTEERIPIERVPVK